METKKGFKAKATFVLMSPKKMRRVANKVRLKPYAEAVALLESFPQKSAGIIKKVIQSAAANALAQNKKLDEEMLYIKDLQINEGPRYKRVWPRARGRRDILLKRLSHVSVVVDEIVSTGE
jgi:large subunit ribosomal protein L22